MDNVSGHLGKWNDMGHTHQITNRKWGLLTGESSMGEKNGNQKQVGYETSVQKGSESLEPEGRPFSRF